MTEIFGAPSLGPVDLRVVEEIERLRRQLAQYVGTEPRRWVGHLRRMSFARAVRGSNWVEGYRASLDDVLDTIEDEEPMDAPSETRAALQGYRDAMTFVLGLAADRTLLDESLLRSMHFMMTRHDLRVSPGAYRQGDVWVADEEGAHVYDAPDASRVESLMAALVTAVNADDGTPAMVRAAMAHLNLAMIHPFRDGNGRMARALQTLLLAREGIVAPVFSSIEEYLGRNTEDYYAVLAEVGGGAWQPQNSARPWIRFILTAHYRQAWTVNRRIYETEHLYDSIEQLVASGGLPARSTGALADAARGLRIRRSIYMTLAEITTGDTVSDMTASRDLRALVDAGLLDPQGSGRGRVYYGSAELRQHWARVRDSRPPRAQDDPYVTLAQSPLPGLAD